MKLRIGKGVRKNFTCEAFDNLTYEKVLKTTYFNSAVDHVHSQLNYERQMLRTRYLKLMSND